MGCIAIHALTNGESVRQGSRMMLMSRVDIPLADLWPARKLLLLWPTTFMLNKPQYTCIWLTSRFLRFRPVHPSFPDFGKAKSFKPALFIYLRPTDWCRWSWILIVHRNTIQSVVLWFRYLPTHYRSGLTVQNSNKFWINEWQPA